MKSFQELQEGIDPKYFEDLKEHYPIKSEEGSRTPPYVVVSSDKYVLHPVFQPYKFKHFEKELEDRRKKGLYIPQVIAIGSQAILFEYMNGIQLGNKLDDSDVDKIARIHRLFLGNKVDAVPFYNTVEKLKNSIDILKEYLGIQTEKLLDIFGNDVLEESLFLTHGDWGYLNLLKDGEKIKIIDLELVDYRPQEYDLFRPLIRICNSENQRRIYLSNFEDVSEKKLIVAALRFYVSKTISRHKYGFSEEAQRANERSKKIMQVGFNCDLETVLKELENIKP